MSILGDLQAQVAATTDVERSALFLIEGLVSKLETALRSNDLSEVAALTAQLRDATAPLAASVAANTSAAPVEEPPVA